MRKLSWIVLVGVLVAAVTGSVLYAQGGGRGGGGGGMAPGAPGAPGTEMERIKLQLEPMGLNAEERKAAEKGLEAKLKARQVLQEDLMKLRRVAEDTEATGEQLTAVVTAYNKALAKYRAVVETEDTALAKQLTPRSHARLLAAGLLDNGLGGGMRFRGGRGGGGMGGPGGRGGVGNTPPPPPRD